MRVVAGRRALRLGCVALIAGHMLRLALGNGQCVILSASHASLLIFAETSYSVDLVVGGW